MNAQAIELYRSLVMLAGGEGVASSRMVATRFKKSHTHALRKLDQVIKAVRSIEPETAVLMFREAIYTDTRGRPQREVLMTHDGFMMLAMRFTGDIATRWQLQFIAAFKWLAGMVMERAENNRLIASFDIKDRESIADGSYHGAGLNRRRVDKKSLAIEKRAIDAKTQVLIDFNFDGDASRVH